MAELPPSLVAALVGSAWVIGLWRLGAGQHPAVASWRRLARLRGLDSHRPLGEHLGSWLPIAKRLRIEADLARLLAVAGGDESPNRWLLRTAAVSIVILVGLLLVDEVGLLSQRTLPAPPGLAVLAAAAAGALAYVRLRNRATERRRRLGVSVADALAHVAVTTYHHRLPASEALIIFARCQRDPSLSQVLAGDEPWRPPRAKEGIWTERSAGSAAVYEALGEAYDVPIFSGLGSALRLVTERGLPAQDVFTRLACDALNGRAAEAKVAAARAKTLIVVPMGLMIIPVLLLIGAPLVAELAALFAR